MIAVSQRMKEAGKQVLIAYGYSRGLAPPLNDECEAIRELKP
jgi:hypothetical protein